MKALPALVLVLATSALAAPDVPATAVLWNAREARKVSWDELLADVRQADQLVLGETHYSEEVQLTEAALLSEFVQASTEQVTLAWEFLNWSERGKLAQAFRDWNEARMDDGAFLEAILGKFQGNASYLPLLRVAKDLRLPVLATNLTRAEKRPVSQGGIQAADPRLVPAGYAPGSAAYFERFVAAMGGHGDPQTHRNYFDAQCLTDDVIADHLARDLATRKSVLVIGSFHTAYFDGAWERMERRSPGVSRKLIHLEKSESPLDEAAQRAFLQDERYGPIADYVVFF